MQYLIPSIISLDSSTMHLFKNQATCAPGIFTLEESPNGGYCGYGNYQGNSDRVLICLAESIDEDLLEGLTVQTIDGNSFETINCESFDIFNECPNEGYACTVDGDYAGPTCVHRLRCPDGTLVDTCPDSSDCLNVE